VNNKDFIKLYKDNPHAYILKITEELSELASAICHHFDDKNNMIDVFEEVADVRLQLDKITFYMMYKWGFSESEVDDIVSNILNKKETNLKGFIDVLPRK
jgi:NTP pyrophosphatase (non-canonical NTP hydrolase)